MRCWKTPKGNYLVEAPNIRRMTHFEPTPGSEGRLLLRARGRASSERLEDGRAGQLAQGKAAQRDTGIM